MEENNKNCPDCGQEECICDLSCCADSCCDNGGWGKKFWLVLVGVLILGTIVVVAILRDRIVNNPQWTVSVIGQGKITINPDIAKITVGVETTKMSNAAEAYKNASETMIKITKAIKDLGIEDKDVQTANYSLMPIYQYENNQNNLSGYQAFQDVTVTVRDLKKVSSLIEKVTSAGANHVNNLMFTIEDMDKVKNEARLKAIIDAKAKSTDYEKAVGVKLGEITGWWENMVQVPYQNGMYGYGGEKGGMGGGAVASTGGPVSYGPMDVVVEINLNYQIK